MDKASNTSYLASQDSVMALHDAAVAAAISVALERKGDRHGPTRAALRAEVERLAAQAAPTEAEYNPLLIDGVQHDPLCLKVYRSPLKECDCGASSRAAQPSQAPVVQAVPVNCGTGYCSCIECVVEPEAVLAREYPPLPEPKLARVRCDECEGSGFLRVSPDPERSDEVCSACRGRGWSSETLVHVEDDIRAFADATCAMRASSGATTQAVRMLTGPECYHLLGRSALSEDQKLAIDVFCAVNAGRTIPPSGGIGGAA